MKNFHFNTIFDITHEPQEVQRFNCACGLIGKFVVIKCHQVLSKVVSTIDKSRIAQFATASSSNPSLTQFFGTFIKYRACAISPDLFEYFYSDLFIHFLLLCGIWRKSSIALDVRWHQQFLIAQIAVATKSIYMYIKTSLNMHPKISLP